MLEKDILYEKIRDKTAVIGVIGLGYVGLPLAVIAAKKGYKVIGIETQEAKVSKINQAVNYIDDINDEDLKMVVSCGYLKATIDYAVLSNVDIVIICVPTPLDKYQYPDVSYIKKSAEEIGKRLNKGMLVVLESTTYPGTTEELLCPILQMNSGLVCKGDFYLAFSPERIDPGNNIYRVKNIPKVVGGIDKESTKLAAEFYRCIIDAAVHEVTNTKVAEMSKILENTYRNVNIGLINEMAILCKKMEISIWEVIEAAKTKPYGFQAFYPGPGLGGHCIPLDPYYLAWKAREFGCHTKLIEMSGEINNYMPQYIVERSAKILNRFNKSLKSSKIVILGIAYKNDISDYRESPSLKIINYFIKEGSEVKFNDPYIESYFYNGAEYNSSNMTTDLLSDADLVVITTAHEKYDYDFIQKNSRYIFDTKNATKTLENKENIELL